MKPRDKLAQEIRSASQPPPQSEAQINFERFLKCREQRAPSNALASALTGEGYRRNSDPDVPLIAPSHILPPMF